MKRSDMCNTWFYCFTAVMLHCTMGLSIEIGERKILKSKWLDFSHFSTKDDYFDLYWCETANILPEK